MNYISSLTSQLFGTKRKPMMYAFTSATVFPTLITIPEPYIDLLDRFFFIVDSLVNDSASNSEKFEGIFSEHGVFKTPLDIYEGHKGKQA